MIEDGVFVGPHVCFTNDMYPRSINADGSPKRADDWVVTPTRIQYGASLGAQSTIVCGITVGRWAMVGSGSVITRNVPAFGLVFGNPARLQGFVCPSGERARVQAMWEDRVELISPTAQEVIIIPKADYDLLSEV